MAHYVREHDVPEVDVAAALAVLSQGETPLLIDPEADRARVQREERRSAPGGRDERSGQARAERAPRRGGETNLATYRINVGKRHKVEPRQIVGALANEGGLSRSDFGKIQIRPDFSLVELPADLGPEVFSALADTRISGKLIELRADNGPRSAGSRPPRGDKPAGDFDRKKPRHKKP